MARLEREMFLSVLFSMQSMGGGGGGGSDLLHVWGGHTAKTDGSC